MIRRRTQFVPEPTAEYHTGTDTSRDDLENVLAENSPVYELTTEPRKHFREQAWRASSGNLENFEHEEDDEEPTDIKFYQSDYDPNQEPINMWTREKVGLYAHYAALGALLGFTGATLRPACIYVYNGSSDLCDNASSLVYFPWSCKLFIALFTDLVWPAGMRRKPYMVFGWLATLCIYLYLTVSGEGISATEFILFMTLLQACALIANVPADGLSVEYARFEPPSQRGYILVTGQVVRFSMGVLTNFVVAFLLNGPELNPPGSEIRWDQMWAWGLSFQQFNILSFVVILACFVPICMMTELDSSNIPRRNLKTIFRDIWYTARSKTTFYIVVWLLTKRSLVDITPKVRRIMMNQVIRIPNLQSGVSSMLGYVYQAFSVITFRNYFLNVNWQEFQYVVEIIGAVYSLWWIFAFFNTFGLRNGWFTVFLGISTQYLQGINQVLGGVTVIEICSPGIEATTYQFAISVSNAGVTLARIIGSQLAVPLGILDVSTESFKAFDNSDGPMVFTIYTIVTVVIALVGVFVGTPFLPPDRAACARWKREGELSGIGKQYGIGSLMVFGVSLLYGLVVSVIFLFPEVSCLEFVGGRGCQEA